MSQTLDIPFSGQEIGQGVSSQTLEALGTALAVPAINEDPVADGQIVTRSFEFVSDQTSLLEAVGVKASVDARYGLFSGGAKMDFAERNAVNSFSAYIAGRCTVINAERTGHGFTIAANAKPLLDAHQTDAFKKGFGDMYVSSLTTGGELVVIVRITCTDQDKQTSFATSLHAELNGLTAAGNFSASFSTESDEVKKHTDISCFASSAGGIGVSNIPSGADPKQVLDMIANFAQLVHNHPIGLVAHLESYETVPLPVETEEEREDRRVVLADCAQQKYRYLGAIGDLNMAIDPDTGPSLFDNLPSTDTLSHMLDQYRTALNGVIAQAIGVAAGRIEPPQIFVSNPPPPPITFKKKAVTFTPPPPPPMVTIPDWGDVDNMDRGGPVPSSDDLGLVIQRVGDALVQDPDERDRGEIVSMSPPAGTVVPRGTVVTVHFRNS